MHGFLLTDLPFDLLMLIHLISLILKLPGKRTGPVLNAMWMESGN